MPHDSADLPRILHADDGFLYLTGGTNHVLRLYRPDLFRELCPIDAWRRIMRRRAAFFDQHAIPWRMLLAPEKLSIYGQSALRDIVGKPVLPGVSFLRDVDPECLIYPCDQLRDFSQKQAVYTRTDSHWTSAGAICAFEAVMSSLGRQLNLGILNTLEPIELQYKGDLWSPDLIDISNDTFCRYAIPLGMEVIYCNPIVGYKEANGLENEVQLHVGSHIIVNSESAQIDETLVLFGSSFSEYRLQCSLLTFVCALFFKRVHFIWSADLDFNYILRHRPDLVIVEMPERFVTVCPPDTFEVESYGVTRLASWLAAGSQPDAMEPPLPLSCGDIARPILGQ